MTLDLVLGVEEPALNFKKDFGRLQILYFSAVKTKTSFFRHIFTYITTKIPVYLNQNQFFREIESPSLNFDSEKYIHFEFWVKK